MKPIDPKPAFAGRTILITGGTRGIAAQIALDLVAQGASVCVSHSEKHDAQAGFAGSAKTFVEGINAQGGHAVAIDQDMGTPDAGTALAQKAIALCGAIDSLVLSASIQIEKPLAQQTNADIELQYRINLTSNIELLNAFLPAMAEADFGRVLAIGSVQETVPSPNMPIYAMTKAAMANLFSNIAREYAPQGVTFNTLSPGLIETDRNTAKRDDPERWAAMQHGANPMSRAGTPSETSPSAIHLLSEQASFITGANLVVSGGAHLGRANPADSARHPISRRPDTNQGSAK
tara:strand:- start:5466 stop:6335 length:870 start_codon:yes stop_codon:yes gene_type:complete